MIVMMVFQTLKTKETISITETTIKTFKHGNFLDIHDYIDDDNDEI